MFPHEVRALKDGKFIVRDHAFGHEAALSSCCYVRDMGGRLRPAKVGVSGLSERVESEARGDAILFLTSEFDGSKSDKIPLFAQLKKWKMMVESGLRFSSSKVSVQLARYEGNGSRYVRHSDVGPRSSHAEESSTRTDEHRLLTFVYYLNPDWREEHGGHLRIYDDDAIHYDVSPVLDRLLIFPSEVEHEVLPSYGSSRWAVTMWLYSTCKPSYERQHILCPTLSVNDAIFVSIACYRDADVLNTVRDLFATASDPHRINVGICWQGDELPASFSIPSLPCPAQIRWCLLPTCDAAGPLHARNVILDRLFRNERYILQIDAHTRFVQSWDLRLIRDLSKCLTRKAILTAYPAGFRILRDNRNNGDKTIIDPHVLSMPSPLLCADKFDENGMLRIVGRQLNSVSQVPTPSIFWAAGFSFSESQAFFERDRPNVTHLFFGEETLMAYYFWRNGWTFYCPSGPNIIFHLWTSRSSRPETALVVSGEERLRATQEYKRLLDSHRTTSSFGQFESFLGIDFSSRTITDKAKMGGRSSWSEFRIEAPLPPKALRLIDRFLS